MRKKEKKKRMGFQSIQKTLEFQKTLNLVEILSFRARVEDVLSIAICVFPELLKGVRFLDKEQE